jgi:GNAT superfamily N-acetyltransferase
MTAADEAAVSALREDALRAIRSARGGRLYVPRPLPAPSDGDRPVWVGLFAGTVVGYLVASSEGTLGRVDAVYVDPGCRAVGVGTAMMAPALAWFRSRGCEGIDALALPGARDTKNFFEETGFTARLLVMHRPL